MARSPKRIPCVEDRAEGDILGFPYNTELANINGVWFHVWLGDTEPTEKLLARLHSKARNTRDVVNMTYSDGKPTSYWAHQDIGEKNANG
jgi:hypothetical protein